MAGGDALVFSSRVLDLTSALSPIIPFVLATLVFFLWTISNLQRAFLLEVQGTERMPVCFQSFRGTPELYSDVLDCLEDPRTRITLLLAPLLFLVPFSRTVTTFYVTLDGAQWSLLFQCLLLSCYLLIVYNFALFVFLWIRLRRLLRQLTSHPLADAFRRLPESCAATPWKLWSAVPNLTTLAASVAQLKMLANLGKDSSESRQPNLATSAREAETLLARAFHQSSQSFVMCVATQRELRGKLGKAALVTIDPLEAAWAAWPGSAQSLPPLRELKDEEQKFVGVRAWASREIPKGFDVWIRAAEEFVALRTSSFIRIVFQHLKNLLSFVFLGFLLVIGVTSSYPFQPKHSVMTLLCIVAFASIVLILWIFIDMERDPVLSFIGKTEPGKVTLSLDFLSSVGVYVVIPLLTLIATQFPWLGDVISSVFNPAMRSLGR